MPPRGRGAASPAPADREVDPGASFQGAASAVIPSLEADVAAAQEQVDREALAAGPALAADAQDRAARRRSVAAGRALHIRGRAEHHCLRRARRARRPWSLQAFASRLHGRSATGRHAAATVDQQQRKSLEAMEVRARPVVRGGTAASDPCHPQCVATINGHLTSSVYCVIWVGDVIVTGGDDR